MEENMLEISELLDLEKTIAKDFFNANDNPIEINPTLDPKKK